MDARVNLSIIAAVSQNNVIGFRGGIPWRLSDDLRRFKRLTQWHTVIAGRTTYESILKGNGKPLPNRVMIVLTHQQGYEAPGCIVVHSWDEALERAKGAGEVFVIGGSALYALAMPVVRRLYLTHVELVCDGDALFPPVEPSEWDVRGITDVDADLKNEYDSTFVMYERNGVAHPRLDQRFVLLENAREEGQLRVMQRIQEGRFCPFCPEHHGECELNPAIRTGNFWSIHVNRWPYPSTELHLLFVHRTHAKGFDDVSPEAWMEFYELIRWAENVYDVRGGALGLRFGDPSINGATVNHLHAHFIVARTDVDHPDYTDVKFRMGPKKP